MVYADATSHTRFSLKCIAKDGRSLIAGGQGLGRDRRHHTRWNVLVVPGGTEIGLEIGSALRDCKETQLFSAGTPVSNHAPFVFAHHYPLPAVATPGWIDHWNRLIADLSIDFVYPAHDDVVAALAVHRAEIGAAVVTSPAETCVVARSKSRTYEVLRSRVPCPNVYAASQVPGFPVFCKPDAGQGSQRARVLQSAAELAFVQPDEIVLEYLPGDEFTVDCFSDRKQGLLFAEGRRRARVRNGISVATAGVQRPEFREYAVAIADVLEFHGAWFFQVKESVAGILTLLEVAPRVAGAMAFHRVQGVNFPLLSVYEQAGVHVQILRQPLPGLQLDRALVNRYRHHLRFRTVYLDLDDTVLVRGQVSLALITFLFQCVNSGVRLILITKHAGELNEVLCRHRIGNLFDEVIHLRKEEEKAAAVSARDAIFIDDSFSERLAVHQRTGLATFDLSMIECLIDHTGATADCRE